MSCDMMLEPFSAPCSRVQFALLLLAFYYLKMISALHEVFINNTEYRLVHLLMYLPFNIFLLICFSAESWGPWLPWSVCSVSCGEGVRERVRECLLPSGVGGVQCTGMVKEQSLCSLEDCVGQSSSIFSFFSPFLLALSLDFLWNFTFSYFLIFSSLENKKI